MIPVSQPPYPTDARSARAAYLLEQARILSDADLRDLSPSDLTLIRKLLSGNLFLFAWFVGGCDIMDVHLHGELCAYIERLGTAPDWQRLMSHIPRDHLKSTVGTVNHALWAITRNPDQPVAIINATTDLPSEWIDGIRRIAEGSPIFQAVYRDLLPPGIHRDDPRSTPRSHRWSKLELDFEGKRIGETEASISGWGTGSACTGHHWPLIIADDLVGKEQAESEAEMEKTKAFARGIIHLMRPSSQGNVYVNGTPWTYNDVSTTFTQELDFRLYRRSALELPDGTPSILGSPIFPSRFRKETFLGEMRNPRTTFTFWAQRMCIPRVGEDTSFSPGWLNPASLTIDANLGPIVHFGGPTRTATDAKGDTTEIPRAVPLGNLSVACFLDPAAADKKKAVTDKHSRSGFIVEGIDQWGRRVVLESFAIREDPKRIIDAMFRLQSTWGFTSIYIEEVAFSSWARHWVIDLQNTGNEYANRGLVPLPALTGGKSKDARVLRLIPGMKSGAYYMMVGSTDDLLAELTEYPHCSTRDLLDALAYDYKLIWGGFEAPANTLGPGDPLSNDGRPSRDAHTGY